MPGEAIGAILRGLIAGRAQKKRREREGEAAIQERMRILEHEFAMREALSRMAERREQKRTEEGEEAERERLVQEMRERIAAEFPRMVQGNQKKNRPGLDLESMGTGALAGTMARGERMASRRESQGKERKGRRKEILKELQQIQSEIASDRNFLSEAQGLRGPSSLAAMERVLAEASAERGRVADETRRQQLAAQAALLGGRNVNTDLAPKRVSIDALNARRQAIVEQLRALPRPEDIRREMLGSAPVEIQERVNEIRQEELRLINDLEELQAVLERLETEEEPAPDGDDAAGRGVGRDFGS